MLHCRLNNDDSDDVKLSKAVDKDDSTVVKQLTFEIVQQLQTTYNNRPIQWRKFRWNSGGRRGKPGRGREIGCGQRSSMKMIVQRYTLIAQSLSGRGHVTPLDQSGRISLNYHFHTTQGLPLSTGDRPGEGARLGVLLNSERHFVSVLARKMLIFFRLKW